MLSSDFHDRNLLSVSVKGGRLTLEISTGDTIKEITLLGLEKLRATDFKEGNVINALRLFVANPTDQDTTIPRQLIKYAYEINEQDLSSPSRLSEFFEKTLDRYLNGSLLILELEPSYGGYIVAIGAALQER